MSSAILRVRLSPRSSRNALLRFEGGILYIRVTAPPVDGAANAALIELLADSLKTRKSAISIKSGASSREKSVIIEGMDSDQLAARVTEALG